ncbi:MAG: NAD(P)/FAD-dependent oxidoreductase [Nevskia sp.]|nr:NAD(P)/FAD-dependent oxidoreductase [Nevskia sp.]
MPRMWDAIAIGAGLGGLTAASLYARSGKRVLVLERNPTIGGAATVHTHAGLSIEASLHAIDGLDAADPKAAILGALGLDHDLTFVDVGPLHEVRSALLGAPFVLPQGLAAALTAAQARFPQHTTALAAYFTRLAQARGTASTALRHRDDKLWWLLHAPALPWTFWPMLRDRHTSLGDVLNQLFGQDEAVKFALAANLGYYADDPDTLPFVAFAIPQASYLIGGGHYIRGGSQSLSDRLAAIVVEAGGAIETGRDAVAILTDHGRATGVRHAARDGRDPREDHAPVLFGDAAPHVLAEMLPDEEQDRFSAPFRDRKLSTSLWTVALGLDRKPAAFGVGTYSTIVLPDWMIRLDQFRTAAAVLGHDPSDAPMLPPYSFVDYSRIDTGLNQEAPFLGTLCGLDRWDNWTGLGAATVRDRKQRWMDRLVRDLDRQFPGIAASIVHREMAIAPTFHHYLNTPRGAVYGFAPTRETGGLNAGSPLTPVANLFLASAFTLAGGFTGAMLGGAEAVRAALKAASNDESDGGKTDRASGVVLY